MSRPLDSDFTLFDDASGLTFDDLDLTDFDDYADDLPPLRPRYEPAQWWSTTADEEHFLDLPSFTSGVERARYMVSEMGRAALAHIDGATADDKMFERAGEMVSLNQLLQGLDHDVVEESLRLL